jgi:ABC-2 type transport system ATP-binding protein
VFYYFFSITIIVSILLAHGLFLNENKQAKHFETFNKVVSLIVFFVFLFRYLLADIPLENIIALSNSPFNTTTETTFAIILNWLFYGAILIVLLNSFYNIKNLKNLVVGFVLPLSIVNLIFLKTNIMAISSAPSIQVVTVESLLYVLSMSLMLVYSIITLKNMLNNGSKIDAKQIKTFLLSIFAILIVTIPSYLLQALFGLANPTIKVIDLSVHHRIFIYISLLLPTILFFVLKNKKIEVIKATLIFISLSGLITFMAAFKFDIINTPNAWPLHLCHTAMYIIPICLVFKLEKLFYFTYFINVFGAFIAILMPNYGVRNLFDPRLISFWVNHWWAFFMPILIVALRVYGRPKLKSFIYSLKGFAIYFVIILFLNAWFSNYGNADFFFINSDFVASKLGLWAENTRNIIFSFKVFNLDFIFYPLYQLLFFIGYILIALSMWFVYEQSYTFADSLTDMENRKSKNKLEKDDFIMQRKKIFNGSVFDRANQNKIIFKNFGKRYGANKDLTVKNINLEINAGEIFGFLGPNGAGKSTVIKSIVGLHTISEGSIQVCGYDVDKQSVETKKIIGFVPDNYSLYEKLTGREYINYISDLYNVSQKDRESRIKKYVDLLNMTNAIDNKINTYSHGMKQKIAIISALVHSPKVWILDEPLTGLDPNSIYQIKECMREHAKDGNIVFFSSHIIDVVEKLCDRIAIIKSGQIVTVKTMQEIAELEKGLENFYLMTIGNI